MSALLHSGAKSSVFSHKVQPLEPATSLAGRFRSLAAILQRAASHASVVL